MTGSVRCDAAFDGHPGGGYGRVCSTACSINRQKASQPILRSSRHPFGSSTHRSMSDSRQPAPWVLIWS
jgi:hypothetical protein